MMKQSLKAAAVALTVALAAPSFAQPMPPRPPMPPRDVLIQRFGPGGFGMMDQFEDMSPEGRRLIMEAMRPQVSPQDRQATKAARDRVLKLIAADKLDVAAIRRAQAVERELVVKQHERQQAAMLDAYQKLSLADRRAFVEGMGDQEERMLKHMQRARERMEEMEKRMRERMKDREGALVIEPMMPIILPLVGPLPEVAGR